MSTRPPAHMTPPGRILLPVPGAETLVNTLERDYVQGADLTNADTVIRLSLRSAYRSDPTAASFTACGTAGATGPPTYFSILWS
jgi:hypothetical protein